MKTIFCPYCLSEQEIVYIKRPETFVVRDEPIHIESTVAQCTRCNHEIFEMEADSKNLQTAYDQYRKNHGLLTCKEIRSIRGKYGLSQRALAKILGWGLITVQRYEQGAIQNAAHDQVLRKAAKDPIFLLKQIETQKDSFSPKQWKRIHSRLIHHLEKQSHMLLIEQYEDVEVFAYKKDPKARGFREFRFNRLYQMILKFAKKTQGLYKTKLAKLLFIADFAHFLRYNKSLTGLVYHRLPYGPVPDRYQTLLGLLEESGIIELIPQEHNTWSGEIIVPGKKAKRASLGVLTTDEIETLEKVIKKYGNLTSKKLSDLSHEEQLWETRATGEILPYEEAGCVKLVRQLWE